MQETAGTKWVYVVLDGDTVWLLNGLTGAVAFLCVTMGLENLAYHISAIGYLDDGGVEGWDGKIVGRSISQSSLLEAMDAVFW